MIKQKKLPMTMVQRLVASDDVGPGDQRTIEDKVEWLTHVDDVAIYR